MIPFNVDMDLQNIIASFTNLNKDIILKASQTIRKWNLKIVNEAIQNVNVDRGQLRQSINEQIFAMGDQIIGKIGTNRFYAPYVHGVWVNGKGWVGPKPHYVPFSVAPDLLIWAKRHHVIEIIEGELYRKDKTGKLKKMSKKNPGLYITGKPNPFIGNAFDKYENAIIQDLSQIGNG